MINFTRVFRPIPSWLNWPIAFNGPTSSTDKQYSLDSEDDFRSGCRNVAIHIGSDYIVRQTKKYFITNNLLLNYRYRQKTSWTYWTYALHRLTFSTTVNTTDSCMEQPWGRLFLLLSQKLWCKTLKNVPLQLAALVTLRSQTQNWCFSRPR